MLTRFRPAVLELSCLVLAVLLTGCPKRPVATVASAPASVAPPSAPAPPPPPPAPQPAPVAPAPTPTPPPVAVAPPPGTRAATSAEEQRHPQDGSIPRVVHPRHSLELAPPEVSPRRPAGTQPLWENAIASVYRTTIWSPFFTSLRRLTLGSTLSVRVLPSGPLSVTLSLA